VNRTQKPKPSGKPLPPIRVRHEPPTVEEALFAAEGLTNDLHQQIEIAAALMNVPAEDVAPLVRRRQRQQQEIVPGRGGQRPQRSFVIERKPARRRLPV
jgi:hypothetical protein